MIDREIPDTVYVPVSTALLAEFAEWSEPVQIRITQENTLGGYDLVCRRPASRLDALTIAELQLLIGALAYADQAGRVFPMVAGLANAHAMRADIAATLDRKIQEQEETDR